MREIETCVLTSHRASVSILGATHIVACGMYRWKACNNTWCVQVLRSPKEAFAAAMQSWRERCEKCVCLQSDYVEK